jgi:hypothetical protein
MADRRKFLKSAALAASLGTSASLLPSPRAAAADAAPKDGEGGQVARRRA